jgi:hypothetical protein
MRSIHSYYTRILRYWGFLKSVQYFRFLFTVVKHLLAWCGDFNAIKVSKTRISVFQENYVENDPRAELIFCVIGAWPSAR